MAIRGHQRSSEVIRGHQRPSGAIRGHQGPSGAISSHQRPSVVISGHQGASEAISRHQAQSRLSHLMRDVINRNQAQSGLSHHGRLQQPSERVRDRRLEERGALTTALVRTWEGGGLEAAKGSIAIWHAHLMTEAISVTQLRHSEGCDVA